MSILAVVVVAALWVAVLARLPAALHRPLSRPFTAAVAIFAAAATLRIPAVGDAINQLGNADSTTVVVGGVLVVLGAATLLEIVTVTTAGTADPAASSTHRRHITTVLVLIALLALGAVAPAQAYRAAYAGPATAGQVVWLVVFWGIYWAYLGSALARVMASCWAPARVSSRRSRRVTYLLLAGGCATGLLWVLDQAALLALNRAGVDPGFTDTAYRWLVAVALVLVAAAAATPIVADLARRLRPSRTSGTSSDLLELWAALAESTPSIVLDPGTIPSEYRVVIEVRDGILAARPFITPAITVAADDVCAGTDDAELASAAVQLDLARQRAAEGLAAGPARQVNSGGGTTISDDTDALRAFAAVWRSPRTRRLVERARTQIGSTA